MPKLSRATWPLNRLEEYAQNTKLHPEDQIESIAASIRKFGFNDPIGVTPEGVILEGHGRLAAARLLEMEEVPVLIVDGLSEDQQDRYRIAHNRIAQLTTFDIDILASELSELVCDDLDIEDMGFTPDITRNISLHRGDTSAKAPVGDGGRLNYEVIWGSAEDFTAWKLWIKKLRKEDVSESMSDAQLIDAEIEAELGEDG